MAKEPTAWELASEGRSHPALEGRCREGKGEVDWKTLQHPALETL